MKNQKLIVPIIMILAGMISSCIPSIQTPIMDITSTQPPAPSTVVVVETSVPVATSIPTIIQTGTNTPVVSASTLISVDNIAELHESASAFQANPQRLIWGNDGKTFAVIGQNQVVKSDAHTLTTSAAFQDEDSGQLLDFSSDGKTVAVTPDQMSVAFYDVKSNELLRIIDIPEMVYGARFSPDGSTIAIASFDEIAVSLWDVSKGDFLDKLTGFETAAPVYDISFSSDGRSIVWHARASVQLQDIGTGKMGPAFEHEDFVSGMAVSPDGKLLATGAGGTVNGAFTPLVTLWNTSSGEELNHLVTITVPYSLDFSTDSHMLAGSVMNVLIIWDIETGKEIFSKDITGESITSVSFSPDGSTLVTTAADNSIRLWRITP